MNYSDLKPQKNTDGTIITSAVTLSFPHLFHPYTAGEFPSNKYECQLLIDRKRDHELYALLSDEIRACLERGAEESWKGKKPAEMMYPIAPDKYAKNNPDAMVLKCKTQFPPKLIDVYGRDIKDEDALYGGAIVRCEIRFFPWLKGIRGGVSCSVNMVQKLADGDKIGGKDYSTYAVPGLADAVLASTTAPATSTPYASDDLPADDLPF